MTSLPTIKHLAGQHGPLSPERGTGPSGGQASGLAVGQAAGAALRAVGDVESAMFPADLRAFADHRSDGDLRVNLLVNYSWQWDLFSAIQHARSNGGVTYSAVPRALASGDVPRVDLVVRWGGRRRLSGFLPVQCAYADFYVIETLWPDSRPEEFLGALEWYQVQDVTMGG